MTKDNSNLPPSGDKPIHHFTNIAKDDGPEKKSKPSRLIPACGLVIGIQSAALIVAGASCFAMSDQLVRANHRFDESIAIGKQLMAGMDEQHKTIEIQKDAIRINQQTLDELKTDCSKDGSQLRCRLDLFAIVNQDSFKEKS